MEGMSTTPVGTPVLDFCSRKYMWFYQLDQPNLISIYLCMQIDLRPSFDRGVDGIYSSVSTDGSTNGDRVLTFTVPEDATGTLLEDVSRCITNA